jgi:hypothetical protein
MDEDHSKTFTSLIEENLDYFYVKSSEFPNFSSKLNENVNWIFCSEVDWPNCIFKTDLVHSIDKIIKDVKRQILDFKAPNSWTVGPLSNPLNLGEILEEHQFKNVYHQSGMGLKLSNLKNSKNALESLEVQIIDDDSLEGWSNCVSKSFNNIKISIGLIKFLKKQENFTFFAGIHENEIVTALMRVDFPQSVTGLHAVSTLPDHRGNGYALKLSRMALIDAFNKSRKIAVLQASSMGEKVYIKLGFRKYCDIYSYELEI